MGKQIEKMLASTPRAVLTRADVFTDLHNLQLTKKPESLLHTLSKRSVTFVVVFPFNVPRSFSIQIVCMPYSFLEDVKDGKAISSKYNSRELKCVTPNCFLERRALCGYPVN